METRVLRDVITTHTLVFRFIPSNYFEGLKSTTFLILIRMKCILFIIKFSNEELSPAPSPAKGKLIRFEIWVCATLSFDFSDSREGEAKRGNLEQHKLHIDMYTFNITQMRTFLLIFQRNHR